MRWNFGLAKLLPASVLDLAKLSGLSQVSPRRPPLPAFPRGAREDRWVDCGPHPPGGEGVQRRVKGLWLIGVLLCFSASVRSQGLGSEALAFFPPNTQQIAYADLSQLRALPNYKQLRQALFTPEMRNLEGFLQSIGSDPEEDVDEVIVGWRANAMSMSAAFGIAEGNFDPSQLQNLAAKGNLPSRQYEGYTLLGYGLHETDSLYITYLGSNLAAFGKLNDLERMVDDYLGRQPSLNSNSQFVNWEAELDGSGAQWGITTGSAAAAVAAPWLGASPKAPISLSAIFKPIKGVLYKVNWSGDFDAQISVICDDSQDTQTLDRLLLLWQSALAATPGDSAPVNQFVRELQISTDGNRLELEGSGPPQSITDILGGARQ